MFERDETRPRRNGADKCQSIANRLWSKQRKTQRWEGAADGGLHRRSDD